MCQYHHRSGLLLLLLLLLLPLLLLRQLRKSKLKHDICMALFSRFDLVHLYDYMLITQDFFLQTIEVVEDLTTK